MYDSSNGAGLRSLLATVVKTNTQVESASGDTTHNASPDTSGGVSPIPSSSEQVDMLGGGLEQTVVIEGGGQDEHVGGVFEVTHQSERKILIVEDSPTTVKLYKKIYLFALSK